MSTRDFFQPPLASYSRSATMSARAAMAAALKRKLESIDLPAPDGSVQRFARVFDNWAEYEQRYVPPAACILPGPRQYSDVRMTPTLIRDTWEPEGRIGWGLFKTNEVVADFEINVRAPTDPERDVAVRGLEDAWLADEVLLDHVAGARNGVVMPLPEYWSVLAEFTLLSGRSLDDGDSVMRGRREDIMVVRGRCPQVVCRPVRPMHLTIRVSTT
jgi:hypothetical protein